MSARFALVLLIAAILEAAGLFYLARQVKGKDAEITAISTRYDQLHVNYRAVVDEAASLRTANRTFAEELRISREAQTQALRSVDTLVSQVREGAQRVRVERETIYRAPNCAELAAIDISRVCPELAVSLRARSAGLSAPH